MSKSALNGLDPLKDLLGDVLARLEALEAKVGIKGSSMTKQPSKSQVTSAQLNVSGHGGEAPAVKAYDTYVKESVVPLAQTCDRMDGLENSGTLLLDAWEGVRSIIVLSSRAKAPSEPLAEALTPFLGKTQEAVKKLRDLRLKRDWDRHQKTLVEMVAALSWILFKPPQQLPAPFVKEALGSAEFWSNRIRKDFKGKDETQIAFCDNVKKALTDLAKYIEEYHKAGLSFNPRGVSIAEAAIVLSDEVGKDAPSLPDGKSPVVKRHPTLKGGASGGNVGGLMSELVGRKNQDGSSAATGLRKVTKDQQTWRKEYKKDGQPAALPAAPSLDAAKKKETKKKAPLRGLPIFEYQDRGFKWVIENHTKETAMKELSKDGIITVEINDPKQQVYLYNCEDLTVKIKGKFKSLAIDNCAKVAVVFDTLISSAEVVNCKKIQLQVNGICPVFTVDKTHGFLVWLSKESLAVSSFATAQSSEMNVSFPDGDDQKELPIPEQFVHRLQDGVVKSEVSDLYH